MTRKIIADYGVLCSEMVGKGSNYITKGGPLAGVIGNLSHGYVHLDESTLWWIAIALTLFGRTLEAIGLMAQKQSFSDADSGEEGAKKEMYIKSKAWRSGFGIYVAGHIMCWFAFSMGTQAVLSCLMCWSSVTTVVFAPLFLGETVTTFRFLSVIMMVCGCVWVILYGPHTYEAYTLDKFRSQASNRTFLHASLGVLCVLACLAVEARFFRTRFSAIKHVFIAAIIGWYSVLLAKVTSSLLLTSWVHKDNQFLHWESFIVTGAMITLSVVNVHFLNMAMKSGDAILVVPVYESVAIIGQIVVGGCFFQEFHHLTRFSDHLHFWGGVSCVILGVICIQIKGPTCLDWLLERTVLSPRTFKRPLFKKWLRLYVQQTAATQSSTTDSEAQEPAAAA